MSGESVSPTIRCDGCGDRTPGASTHKNEDGDVIAKYCPGCLDYITVEGIEPGDHEQYKLREGI